MTTARAPRPSVSPRNPARRARRVPRALCAWSLAVLAPATLAGSPITHNFGLTNQHLQVHHQAVGQANQFNHPQSPQTVQQALDFARMALQLHARLDPVPFADVGGGGGTFPARGGGGASLTTDLFVQQQLSIDNWAPGGSNFPGAFNDRGTLVEQGGNLVVTPTSSYQIGNFNLQTASINGQYYYVNDLDAYHGPGSHSPFDITAGASGSADNTTDTSEVRVNLQWVGLYDHPDNAYDAPQGGGYPAPIGALDFFTFDIVGNAAAQYFNPTGLGGSNVQPGLPDLPQLPDLPDFGDDVLPNELAGLNPYGPPVSRSNGPGDYNPYNPTDYTNGYNPYLASSPYNASGAGGNNGYNPYLASSPYNASGAPDTSAYLAARGGSAHDADGYSQFDQTWLTAIQQEQGVRSYLDYGSFSSESSAAFRGIHRPLQLTAVNQDELATWIQDNGRMPSTIATEVQVKGDVQGYSGFSNYNEYIANRDDGTVRQVMQDGAPTSRGNAPTGYDSRPGTGDGTPTNDNLLAYNNTNVGNNAPSGYRGGPLFEAGNPGGNRIGSFNTANSYDDNTQGNAHSDRSGFAPLGGDVLGYGGATGYDGYDSSAERARQQADIDADLERRTAENIARMEAEQKARRDAEAMQDLTETALELASLGGDAPRGPPRIGVNPEEQERLFEESMTVDPEIKKKLEEQERRRNEPDPVSETEPVDDTPPARDTSERDREREKFLKELNDIDTSLGDVETELGEIEASLRFHTLNDDDINALPPELQAEFLKYKANEDIVAREPREPGMLEKLMKESGVPVINNEFIYRGLNPFYEGNTWSSIGDFFAGSSLPVEMPGIGKLFDGLVSGVEELSGQQILDYRIVHHDSGSVGSLVHFGTPQIDKFIREQEKVAWGKVEQTYGSLQPGDTVTVTHTASKLNLRSDFFEAMAGTDTVNIEVTISRAADGTYSFEKSGKVIRVDEFKDPLDLAQWGPLKGVGASEHGLAANLGNRPFAIVLEQDL